jgi:hypothetical protein
MVLPICELAGAVSMEKLSGIRASAEDMRFFIKRDQLLVWRMPLHPGVGRIPDNSQSMQKIKIPARTVVKL